MRKIMSLLFAFSLIIMGTAQAGAAVIDASGAAALKKLVAQEMQFRVDMAKIVNSGLTMDGKVTVTPEKTFYAVTLPHLSVIADAQGHLAIGTVVIHAVPGKTAGTWQLEGALPAAMTFFNAKNVPQARIAIGKQHFSATWLPDVDLYPKMEAAFENIKIATVEKDPLTVTVAALRSSINLKESKDAGWNGQSRFEASDIKAHVAGADPLTVTVAKAISHSTYDRLGIKHANDLKTAMQAAMKEKMPQTQKEKNAFIMKFLFSPPVPADGIDSLFEIDRLSLRDKGTKTEPAHRLSLQRLAFSGKIRDAEKDKSRVHVTASFSGLDGSFITPPFADFVPRDFNADIALGNMPLKEIKDMLLESMQKFTSIAPGNDAARKLATADMKAREMMLPGLMARDSTALSVTNTYARNKHLDIRLDGNIYANSTAASGAVGKMTLSIAGFGKIIPKLKKEALKPDADPRLLVYLGEMITLQRKGVEAKIDGRSARKYTLEMTQSGSILLNGKDIRKSIAEQTGMTAPKTAPQTPAEKAQGQQGLGRGQGQAPRYKFPEPAMP